MLSVKENRPSAPTSFALSQNFPNPFNAATMLSFDISESGTYILEVYDLSGKLVNVLTNGNMNRGHYDIVWDASTADGKKLPSGTYLFRLRDEAGNCATRSMTLVK